jgi:hypothetical protein
MKDKLNFMRLLCLLLISCNYSFGQSELDKFITGLSNDSLRYEIVKIGTANLKKNNMIVLPKTVVVVNSVNIKSLGKKYNKPLLVKRLISVLGDTNKDWYANVLLYALTEKDATSLLVIDGRDDWLRINKSKDIEYWNFYLKNRRVKRG